MGYRGAEVGDGFVAQAIAVLSGGDGLRGSRQLGTEVGKQLIVRRESATRQLPRPRWFFWVLRTED